MADQAAPPGASGASSSSTIVNAANSAAQAAVSNMAQASKMAETLFDQAAKASGEQQDAYIKMATMLDKIAKQQAEVVKINTELQDLESKRLKLQKEMADLGDKATDEQKKQLQQLREEVTMKKSAAIEAKKAAVEQSQLIEKMSKQQGVLGKMFEASKTQMFQYLAGVATLSAALTNMAKVTQDVLDVSALSGNYAALQDGVTGVIKSAYMFQKGMAESRVGLRFLGYSADEVNSSFKELSVTASKVGGKLDTEGVAQLTTVTGRLARMLGVSLPEATQYMITMQQRFGASTSATAETMLGIYVATDKYNKEAGRTVIVGRDLTKVMFDLSRETKGAALDQQFLSQTLQANLLQLQAQGRNYSEALEQSSLFVKKMSAEAPDWTKILAGRELRKQFASAADITPEMTAQLERARPGLTQRIKEILNSPVDEFTKQRKLQEALSGTQVGFESMGKGVSQLIDRLGDKANIALQQIYGINATEADALITQTKRTKELAGEKDKLYKLDREAAAAQLMSQYKISKEQATYLLQKENEADLTGFLQDEREKSAAQQVKVNDENAKQAVAAQLAALREQRANTTDKGVQGLLDKRINALDSKAGLTSVESKTGKELESIQGEKGSLRENLSEFYEKFLKNPLTLTAAGITLMAGKQLLELPGTLRALPGDLKDLFKGFRGGPPGGGGSALGGELRGAEEAAEAIAKKPGLLGKLGRGGGSLLSKVTGGGSARALEGIGAKLGGAGLLKLGGKFGKAIPLLGTLVSAGFLAKDAWGIAQSIADGKGVSASQLASAGLNAAGLVPGLGTVAALTDIGLSATGAYDKLDRATGPIGSRLNDMPMNALPETAVAGGGGAGGAAAAAASQFGGAGTPQGKNQIQFQANPIQGAQGVDVEFIGRIPFAQLMQMNLAIMSKGVRGPTGS